MKLVGLLLLVILVILMWFFPSAMPVLGMSLLLLSFGVVILPIIKKQRELYKRGNLTSGELVRKIALEVFGILLAMALAGLAGRYLGQIVSTQITDELIKLIAGTLIGLLAGIGVGILVKRTWGQILKINY